MIGLQNSTVLLLTFCNSELRYVSVQVLMFWLISINCLKLTGREGRRREKGRGEGSRRHRLCYAETEEEVIAPSPSPVAHILQVGGA